MQFAFAAFAELPENREQRWPAVEREGTRPDLHREAGAVGTAAGRLHP